jgi:hypothetical protein
MKKIISKAITCFLFFAAIPIYSQSDKYVDSEKGRLQAARATETEIDKFITLNLKSYQLTDDILDEITSRLILMNWKRLF